MSKEVKDVAQVVSEEKYFLTGEDYMGMARRCAKFMAAAEQSTDQMKYWEEKFYELILNKRFIPGGRILANAGTYFDDLNLLQKAFLEDYIACYPANEKRCGQMLNCYVLEIKDSKHGEQGIYETLEDAADITAMEGGVGENFSALRPKGSPIKGNPKYKSSGPISFLKLFDASSKQLRQGGGRRGANMAVMNVDHPDIMEFITCKSKEGEIDNYNISVGLTDDFMNAVLRGTSWDLKFDGKVYETILAQTILRKIAEHSHKDSSDGGGAGDPGFIFLDTIGKAWPFQHNKPICSNPCGEQLLNSDEACDLGAMNLYAYYLGGGAHPGAFNFETYEEDIATAIRFLDNVLTMNNYPLKYRNERSKKITMQNRRIGLGIMGLADILMVMRIPYDDIDFEDNFVDEIMGLLDSQSSFASFQLGKEKGPFFSHLTALEKYKERRNCCVTTIAPTGTTSMIAGVNGGCEPFFGLVTKKNTTDGSGNVYYMVPDSFRSLCKEHKVELTDERLEYIYNNKGSVQGLHWVPESIQVVAKTTMDLSADAHIKMQCRLQKYIENSISKTINLPNSATIDDVYNSIIKLWQGGAKGGTIYRDGSRKFQILNVGGSKPKEVTPIISENECLEERPHVLPGKTYQIITKTMHKPENAYITINEHEGRPVEVFMNYSSELNQENFLDFLMHNNVPRETADIICSKFSHLSKENTGIITRLISLCLRYNVPIPAIIKQLNKINGVDIYSLPKRIAKILGSYVPNGTDTNMLCQNFVNKVQCGGELIFQEGCFSCRKCGDSKCG